MTKVTWVIEHGIFDNEQQLIDEVRKQGHNVIEIDYRRNYYIDDLCRNPRYCELLEQPVIFRGSLNLSREVARITPWIPGTYCNEHNFNCSTYYTYWGKYMLNSIYSIKSVAETIRMWQSPLILNQERFIRPDSEFKQFTGATYTLDGFHRLNLNPELLVVSSTVKQVDKEWRFVVSDNYIIAGSQYLPNESNSISDITNAYVYLQSILYELDWKLDFIYTVDVCYSNGKFSVVELNSFSCSNLYDCNLTVVIETASQLAIDEWRDVNEIE